MAPVIARMSPASQGEGQLLKHPLNPFEQLELFLAEPRTAFEELATMLLRDCGKTDGRVSIFLGDGGIDAYKGEFSKNGQLTVYQSKYFTKVWTDSQKQKIRESFERASGSNDFTLAEWFLCIPVRPTRQDLRWFDKWREKKSVPIDLIDGDDLTKMLADEKRGSRTRQQLRDWGVFTVRDGYPVIQARVRCRKPDPRTRQTFRLLVSIENRGDRTADDIRVKVWHSDTHGSVSVSDSAFWNDDGTGSLNPRQLQAKRNLHPGESVDTLLISLVPAPVGRFQLVPATVETTYSGSASQDRMCFRR